MNIDHLQHSLNCCRASVFVGLKRNLQRTSPFHHILPSTPVPKQGNLLLVNKARLFTSLLRQLAHSLQALVIRLHMPKDMLPLCLVGCVINSLELECNKRLLRDITSLRCARGIAGGIPRPMNPSCLPNLPICESLVRPLGWGHVSPIKIGPSVSGWSWVKHFPEQACFIANSQSMFFTGWIALVFFCLRWVESWNYHNGVGSYWRK